MAKFWQAALGVAGIGAIGFFAFWSLYKQWLSLPVFPELTQEQAYSLLKIFLFLTFGALSLAVVAFIITYNSKGHDENFFPVKNDSLKLPNGNKITDEQFETYKNVWTALQNVRNTGNTLWESAGPGNLNAFIEALRVAVKLINDGSIFFTKADYDKLERLIHVFEEYKIGKQKLFELRDTEYYRPEDIRRQMRENGNHLKEYSRLLRRIRKNYHDRLSWEKVV